MCQGHRFCGGVGERIPYIFGLGEKYLIIPTLFLYV